MSVSVIINTITQQGPVMEKIYYKPKINANTRDNLRELNDTDQQWIKTTLEGYLALPQCPDVNPMFCDWFKIPNKKLPVQPLKRMERNSPRTLAEGLLAKINQPKNRRDLSPQQCTGYEQLTELMAGIFDIPAVKFVEKGTEDARPRSFNKIFKR